MAAKVTVPKEVEEAFRSWWSSPENISPKKFKAAVGEILQRVDAAKSKPKKVKSWDHSFDDLMTWLMEDDSRDFLTLPSHAGYGTAVARVQSMLGHLGVTREDIRALSLIMRKWKSPMALEKFTALLPSLLTEAKASGNVPNKTWKPQTWEQVDDEQPGHAGLNTSDF